MKSGMRFFMTALTAAIVGSGCTTMSLERHTANQISSIVDYRYQQTLDCLATVAANPASLPSYALLSAGITKISDSGSLASSTLWQHTVPTSGIGIRGFASQSLTASLSRVPTESWTLIAISDHSQLEAMRCACRWVLNGPNEACDSCPGLLAAPDPISNVPGPRFGVEDRLRRLPGCWLHVGRCKDVPLTAIYKSRCGDTWVWVMPDGLEGLADFTLVLQDIATLDVNVSTPPQIVLKLTWVEPPPVKGSSDLMCTEYRVVRPQFVAEVQAVLLSQNPLRASRDDWDRWTTPLPGRRTDISPTGPNSALRSQDSAANRFVTPPTTTFPPIIPPTPPTTFPKAP
jgi:hypothetical protein